MVSNSSAHLKSGPKALSLPIENVTDYPRPPALERVAAEITVELAGTVIAQSRSAFRVLETHHAPTYYIPPSDVLEDALLPQPGQSFCEWKGQASYFTVRAGEHLRPRAAWCYPRPTPAFAALADHVAFYAHAMDRCTVGEVDVVPQPGDFYGGWVTPNLKGTIKGAPGTEWW